MRISLSLQPIISIAQRQAERKCQTAHLFSAAILFLILAIKLSRVTSSLTPFQATPISQLTDLPVSGIIVRSGGAI